MKKLIPIINLATKLAAVKRTTGYRSKHLENDAEHCYQLALTCWAANKLYNLHLDDELILKFALIHDLAEAYTGDIDAFDNPKAMAAKKENEDRALQKMKKEFGNFAELFIMIDKYENREKILEAKLVHTIDKLMVDVNVFYSKGNYYKKRKITIDDWQKWLLKKINYDSINPKLKFLVDESINKIKTSFKNSFYRK